MTQKRPIYAERKDEMAETRFCGGRISLVVERAECLSYNYFHGMIRYTFLFDDMPDFTDASNLDGTARQIEVSPKSKFWKEKGLLAGLQQFDMA